MFHLSKRTFSILLAFAVVLTMLNLGFSAQAAGATALPILVDGTVSNFSGLVSDTSGKTLFVKTGVTEVNTNNYLQLTKYNPGGVGTVVRRSPIQLGDGFSTYFVVNMANQQGGGGDGLCFIVYDSSKGVQSGAAGINLGYSNYDGNGSIIEGDSVAVELDTYCNSQYENLSGKSNTYRHVAVDTNDWDGSRPNNSALSTKPFSSTTGANILHSSSTDTTSTDYSNPTDDGTSRVAHSYSSLNDGSDIHVWVDLVKNSDNTAEVIVTYGTKNVRTSSDNYTFKRKLPNQNLLNDSVYVGFSATTGSATEDHIIKKWYFSNKPITGGIDPVSGSYEQAISTVSVSPSAATNPSTATVQLYDASGAVMSGKADIYIDSILKAIDISVGTSGYIYSIPAGLGIGSHKVQAVASGGSSADADFSMSATPYTATVNVKTDGSLATAPGTVELKQGGTTKYTATASGTTGVYTAEAISGDYDVYINSLDTKTDINISGAANSATVNYYTVSFSAANAGAASGSTISATAGGSSITSGSAVLSGSVVVITGVGAGADNYTYLWSGTGTSGEKTASLNIASLSGTVNAICTVTGSQTPSPVIDLPSRTIAVTENSSGLFSGASGAVMAEANMSNAFSGSVEVKVTETNQKGTSFGFGSGTNVYPFDISLYIKGTSTKTEPASGYAVTISLPIPKELLNDRERLFIAHKSDDGKVTTLKSDLKQIGGVWYLVFEATKFSPYALVVNNLSSYDTAAGLPYYLKGSNSKVFIGFASDGKYLAPYGTTVLFTPNPKNFTDISTHWGKTYIDFVTEREIFLGTATDVFSPDTGMTRAMFATVIGRLYERSYGEISSSDARAFTDCNYDDYYGKYVDWAAKSGIILGVGSNQFQPDRQVSRQEMAAMLYRFAEFMTLSVSTSTSATLNYSDALSISSWAKDAALFCQETGIVTGRNGSSFAPTETATRAEVTAIIQRFIKLMVK